MVNRTNEIFGILKIHLVRLVGLVSYDKSQSLGHGPPLARPLPPQRRQNCHPHVLRLAFDGPSDGVHLAAQGIDLVE